MQEEKLITIITTFYNAAPYLKRWAISVATQTYLDRTRVIVLDDGSTDDSLSVMKKYIAEYKIPAELFIHEKNLGTMQSQFELYGMIDTKYFTVLDADDYWLTEKKLEKAVDFLEAHEDFSIYAGNYAFEYKNGKIVMAIPRDVPSQAFPSLKSAPFFQTSSVVFRNFFTPDLLSKIDDASKKYNDESFRGDSFRNFLAFKFGKLYFENSLDSVYRCDIGIVWGLLTEIEQNLLNSKFYFEMFEFYKDNFGLDDNANKALDYFVQFYFKSIQNFFQMIKDGRILNFECKDYFKRSIGQTAVQSDDATIIFNTLLEQCKRFNELGLKM